MLGSAVAGGEPVYPTMGLNDRLGAIGLLVAILSALVARERTGEGQLVETSLLGWAVNLQSVAISYTANTGKDLRPLPRLEQDDPNYNVYQLKDGSWTALGMTIHPDKYWPILCDALGVSRPRRRPAVRHPGRAPGELQSADRHLRRRLRHAHLGRVGGANPHLRADRMPGQRADRPARGRAGPRERVPRQPPSPRPRDVVVRADPDPLLEDPDRASARPRLRSVRIPTRSWPGWATRTTRSPTSMPGTSCRPGRL